MMYKPGTGHINNQEVIPMLLPLRFGSMQIKDETNDFFHFAKVPWL